MVQLQTELQRDEKAVNKCGPKSEEAKSSQYVMTIAYWARRKLKVGHGEEGMRAIPGVFDKECRAG